MVGFVDGRTAPATPLPMRPAHWLVLVAVASGLLLGAMVCAAGLAGGVAHGASHGSVVDQGVATTAHAGHSPLDARPDSTHPGGHGERSGDTSAAGSHPGMTCVVSVDLRFPDVSPPWVSDSHVTQPASMAVSCSDDVDPPVPRIS